MSEDLDAAAREIIDSNPLHDPRHRRSRGAPLGLARLLRPRGLRDRSLEIYSRRVVGHGGQAFTDDDLLTARRRLYRAAASEHFILDLRDRRIPVTPDK